MPGPPPQPTKLRVLRGNPGKRKVNKAEPQPAAGDPLKPAWLSGEASAEWDRKVPQLRAVGLLTVVDDSILAAYCQAWAELVEATRTLDAEGRVIDHPVYSRRGQKVGSVKRLHPAVKLQRDAFARVKQFLGEFGLSPASRTRLQTTPHESPDANPLADLFRRAAEGRARRPTG